MGEAPRRYGGGRVHGLGAGWDGTPRHVHGEQGGGWPAEGDWRVWEPAEVNESRRSCKGGKM